MPEISKEQVSNVKALLESARRDGCLELLMTALRDEPFLSEADSSEFEVLSPHSLAAASMTDASKRRGDDGSLNEPPCSKQRPVLSPEIKTKDGGKPFPPGVRSMEEWGRTILPMGKYAKENLTYADLSDSTEQAKQAYCQWMISQKGRDDLNPVFRDFIKYLQMRESATGSGEIYYPGSTIVRKMRQ